MQIVDRPTKDLGALPPAIYAAPLAARLMRRGLRGVKLVITDAPEGLKAAVAKVLKASWQRCRVHFLRNALAYANRSQQQMVFALIHTILAQESADPAHNQWRIVAVSANAAA